MIPITQDLPSAVQFAGVSRMHVALYAADIPRAVAFYRTLFGVEPVKVRADYAKFEVAEPSVNLSLNLAPADAARADGVSHFGIQVQSSGAVAAAIERLGAAGLAVDIEDGTTCCYAVQDKVWVQDPDGHRWEVFVVLDADAPGHSDNRAATTACCVPDPGAAADALVQVAPAATPNATEACCTPGCCETPA